MKKRFIQAPTFSKSGAGFTLIELTIIFSVIAILSVIGISVSIDYNRTQIVNSAYEGLKTTINTAKSRALSQRKPSNCDGTLSDYRVYILQSPSRYYMRAVCPDPVSVGGIVKLPENVTFDSTPTFIFPVLIGGSSGGTVTLTGYNKSRTITVDSAGNIQ